MNKNINKQNKKELNFVPLGGVQGVTKNLFVYETDEEIILVDCGIGFPDEPVDSQDELLYPDLSYLMGKKDKIKALIISHAHFDHYGAVPYFFERMPLRIPVYSSKLTREYIKLKLRDSKLSADDINFKTIDPEKGPLKFADFEVDSFHINHSVPESLGLRLKTPVGNIFHVTDYKFDWTPVNDQPFDIQKLCRLASEKQPRLLISDCLGANKKGYTRSEAEIEENFTDLMYKADGLVVVTTVSSNISRIKQAIAASAKVGRKTAFLGFSLRSTGKIAKKAGYLDSLKKHIIANKQIKKTPRDQLTVIAAGSYGQSGSALERISRDKHRMVKLQQGDLVIFSADPSPPGVILDVNNMIDNLTRKGAEVHYYEIQENLYVSGHGASQDIKMLLASVKAENILPIGGDYRHMHAYKQIGREMGYKNGKIILLDEQDRLRLFENKKVII
jgi:ribonuclease J